MPLKAIHLPKEIVSQDDLVVFRVPMRTAAAGVFGVGALCLIYFVFLLPKGPGGMTRVPFFLVLFLMLLPLGLAAVAWGTVLVFRHQTLTVDRKELALILEERTLRRRDVRPLPFKSLVAIRLSEDHDPESISRWRVHLDTAEGSVLDVGPSERPEALAFATRLATLTGLPLKDPR